MLLQHEASCERQYGGLQQSQAEMDAERLPAGNARAVEQAGEAVHARITIEEFHSHAQGYEQIEALSALAAVHAVAGQPNALRAVFAAIMDTHTSIQEIGRNFNFRLGFFEGPGLKEGGGTPQAGARETTAPARAPALDQETAPAQASQVRIAQAQAFSALAAVHAVAAQRTALSAVFAAVTGTDECINRIQQKFQRTWARFDIEWSEFSEQGLESGRERPQDKETGSNGKHDKVGMHQSPEHTLEQRSKRTTRQVPTSPSNLPTTKNNTSPTNPVLSSRRKKTALSCQVPTPPATPPATKNYTPGSKKVLQKLADSPYSERSDSVIKHPRIDASRVVTPRQLPYFVPGTAAISRNCKPPSLSLLVQSGVLTPRGTLKGNTDGRGSSDITNKCLGQLEGQVGGDREYRPGRSASAPSKREYRPGRSASASFSSLTERNSRPVTAPCSRVKSKGKIGCLPSSDNRSHPPNTTQRTISVPSSTSGFNTRIHMEDNPYEIVEFAMADKTIESMSPKRWPFGKTWISGEARYDGYCTPLLPANQRYGINGTLRRHVRCGMEFLEQLYASSVKLKLPNISECGPDESRFSKEKNEADGRHISIIDYTHQLDELVEKISESQKMSRNLVNSMDNQREWVAQMNAVDEVIKDNHALHKTLQGGDHCLYWAERRSRESVETQRKISYASKEAQQAQSIRMLELWAILVHKKKHSFLNIIRKAQAEVKERIIDAAKKIQALRRGYSARSLCRMKRLGKDFRFVMLVQRMQNLARGRIARRRAHLRRSYIQGAANSAAALVAEILFEAQRAFQEFDKDKDGLISASEFVATLARQGVHLDNLAIELIFTKLPAESDYRKACMTKQKAPAGQSGITGQAPSLDHPALSFSDFCLLINVDAPRQALVEMQKAIGIFLRLDSDGSGFIDEGEELDCAMAEMEQATGKKPDAKLLVELLLMGGGKLNFSTFVKVFLFSEDPEDVKKREQEMIFKEIKKREEMYQKSLRAKRMREEIIEEKKKKEEESINDFDKGQDRDDI